MKTRLIACLALFAAVVAYGQEPKGSPTEKRTAKKSVRSSSDAPWRQKWEYSVLSTQQVGKLAEGGLQAGLNRLGEEGWELVAVEVSAGQAPETASYYFKRATTPAVSGVISRGAMGGFGGPREGGGFGTGTFGRGGFGAATEARDDRPQRRPGGTATSASSAVAGAEKHNFQVVALKHAPAADLGRTLQGLFAENVRILADSWTNSLIVAATQEQMRTIRELVAQLDQPRRELKN